MTVLILPTYTVIPDKDVWVIEKENKEWVGGNWSWPTEVEANKYLDRLVSMNYCQKGDKDENE